MDLELKTTELLSHVPLEGRTLTAEETVEFVLSDYCADAGRILSWHTEPILREKRVREGGFDLKGEVCVTVLYAGMDADGLRSCMIKVPFDLGQERKEPLSFLEAEAYCESCECRLLNARKILCRCRIAVSLTPYEMRPLRFISEFDPPRDLGICRLKKELQSVLLTHGLEKEFRFVDSLPLLLGKGSAEEVLFSRVSPRVLECKLSGTKVVIKGEMRVFALWRGEEGGCFSASGNLPFAQMMDAPEGLEETALEGSAAVKEHTAALTLGAGGQSLEVQVTAELSLKVKTACRGEYLADLYGIRCAAQPETEVFTLAQRDECLARREELRAAPETALRAESIIGCDAVCGGVKTVKEGNSYVLRAPLTLKVLYLDETGTPALAQSHGECETRLEGGEGCQLTGEKATVTAAMAVPGEGGIECRGEVEFTACLRSLRRQAVVVGVNTESESGEKESEAPSVAVRRMGKGDTLWQLAKTHRTTVEAIEKANGAIVEEGALLLIPKARA